MFLGDAEAFGYFWTVRSERDDVGDGVGFEDVGGFGGGEAGQVSEGGRTRGEERGERGGTDSPR